MSSINEIGSVNIDNVFSGEELWQILTTYSLFLAVLSADQNKVYGDIDLCVDNINIQFKNIIHDFIINKHYRSTLYTVRYYDGNTSSEAQRIGSDDKLKVVQIPYFIVNDDERSRIDIVKKIINILIKYELIITTPGGIRVPKQANNNFLVPISDQREIGRTETTTAIISGNVRLLTTTEFYNRLNAEEIETINTWLTIFNAVNMEKQNIINVGNTKDTKKTKIPIVSNLLMRSINTFSNNNNNNNNNNNIKANIEAIFSIVLSQISTEEGRNGAIIEIINYLNNNNRVFIETLINNGSMIDILINVQTYINNDETIRNYLNSINAVYMVQESKKIIIDEEGNLKIVDITEEEQKNILAENEARDKIGGVWGFMNYIWDTYSKEYGEYLPGPNVPNISGGPNVPNIPGGGFGNNAVETAGRRSVGQDGVLSSALSFLGNVLRSVASLPSNFYNLSHANKIGTTVITLLTVKTIYENFENQLLTWTIYALSLVMANYDYTYRQNPIYLYGSLISIASVMVVLANLKMPDYDTIVNIANRDNSYVYTTYVNETGKELINTIKTDLIPKVNTGLSLVIASTIGYIYYSSSSLIIATMETAALGVSSILLYDFIMGTSNTENISDKILNISSNVSKTVLNVTDIASQTTALASETVNTISKNVIPTLAEDISGVIKSVSQSIPKNYIYAGIAIIVLAAGTYYITTIYKNARSVIKGVDATKIEADIKLK